MREIVLGTLTIGEDPEAGGKNAYWARLSCDLGMVTGFGSTREDALSRLTESLVTYRRIEEQTAWDAFRAGAGCIFDSEEDMREAFAKWTSKGVKP